MVLRALAIFSALVTLASLPCLIAWLVVGTDDSASRREDALRRAERRSAPPPADDMPPQPPRRRRSIERVAADLRRISGELRDGRPLSPLRREAGVAAYDELLREACAMLGIAEHLGELTGEGHLMDREIERVRVEAELEAAGLFLPTFIP